jgi:hypothetical protein
VETGFREDVQEILQGVIDLLDKLEAMACNESMIVEAGLVQEVRDDMVGLAQVFGTEP